MKKIDNFETVEGTQGGGFKRLPAGGYICQISKVEDIPEKEYLKIEYDIIEGEYRLWWSDTFDRAGFWGGKFIRSYKETAERFFKGCITSMEESNKGFKWDWIEQNLVGKKIGLVLGEEEYIGAGDIIKTRLYVAQNRNIDSIKKGDFTVPDKKKIAIVPESKPFDTIPDLAGDDLPF